MKPHILSFVFILLSSHCLSAQEQVLFNIGVLADIQYVDAPNARTRYYRESLSKLPFAVNAFNQEEVNYVIDLGDRIDHNYESFRPIDSIMNGISAPIFLALGNHDFSVSGIDKKKVLSKGPGRKGWFSINRGNWKMIILNGQYESTTAWPEHTKKHQRAQEKLDALKIAQESNAYDWNGGLGSKQRKWLKSEIKRATRASQNILLFCHQPVHEKSAHGLWDSSEVLDLLEAFDGDLIWVNGHNHAGEYRTHHGMHFLNLHGMVEGDNYSFGVLEIYPTRVELVGYGDQPGISMKLHSFR